jgi:hypothetical protein
VAVVVIVYALDVTREPGATMSELVTKDDLRAALRVLELRLTLMLGAMVVGLVLAVVAIRALP